MLSNSQTQLSFNKTWCWNKVLLCFCGSRLLHHLSQARGVQQRGTCISWTSRLQLHFDNCSSSGINRTDLMGVLPPRELYSKLHFCQCDRVDIQPWKWVPISEIRNGNGKTGKHVSLMWRQVYYCVLYVQTWLRVSIQNFIYFCMCSKEFVLFEFRSKMWNDLSFIKSGTIVDFWLQMMGWTQSLKQLSDRVSS